jgi:hypothetical protein
MVAVRLAHRAAREAGRMVKYSIGWAIIEAERQATTKVPASGWPLTRNADGGVRDGAQAAS